MHSPCRTAPASILQPTLTEAASTRLPQTDLACSIRCCCMFHECTGHHAWQLLQASCGPPDGGIGQQHAPLPRVLHQGTPDGAACQGVHTAHYPQRSPAAADLWVSAGATRCGTRRPARLQPVLTCSEGLAGGLDTGVKPSCAGASACPCTSCTCLHLACGSRVTPST